MSLPRLLSSPAVHAQGQRLAAGPAVLPAHISELIEQARAEGYAAGHAAGIADARRDEMQAADAAGTALRAAVEQEIARLRDANVAYDSAMIGLATQIATYVVDAVDTSAVVEVARRVHAALEQIDDTNVVAHVHSEQVPAVARALAGTDVSVVPADDVAAGDVRLVGRWSVADLSKQQRWAAVRELLDAAA